MAGSSRLKGSGAPKGTHLVGSGDIPALLANARDTFSDLPGEIVELAEIFSQAGEEIALVGGPVRDAFLGLSPNDFDLTTSARPEKTEELLDQWATKVWTVGREFGTIAARRHGLEVEVTTYRVEEYQEDSRKPQVAYGDSLEGDLSRRDFTINAVAMRLPQMVMVDPFDGLEDLAQGILRTPISAEQSFRDDPLRIMRAARFAAQLGVDVSPDVMAAMEDERERLEIVSAERIRTELEKLILSKYPRRGLELLVYTGVADLVLPELSGLAETVDEHGRHKDVYEHTLTVLEQAIDLETGPDGPVPGPDFVLRFAALMHDVGKPATRRFVGNQVTFRHHDVVGAKMTRKRMQALKFDKATTNAVSDLVAKHLRFHGYGDQAWTDAAVRRYVTDAGDQLERLHRLTRADSTTRNRRKALRLSAAYDDLEERIVALRSKEELDAVRPDLSGEEIMEVLDLKPSPQVGEAYRFLLDLRLEEGPLGKTEATKRLTDWWASRN